MFDIFKSEFKRYRLWAAIFAIGQIFMWILYSKMDGILIPRLDKHAVMTFGCIVAGLTFGLLATTLHTRKNDWTFLVHRPLSVKRIHIALSAANLLLLFCGFVLPFICVLLSLDLFTLELVEIRHYSYAMHLMAITAIAYFIGQFTILSPNKGIAIAIWVLAYLIVRLPESPLYFALVDTTVLLICAYLAHRMFNVGLSEFSAEKPVILLTVLLLQPALLIVFLSLQTFYYHLPLTLLGIHPDTPQPTQTINHYAQLQRQELPKMFQHLLAASESPLTKTLSRQVSLAEFKNFYRTPYYRLPKNGLFMHEHASQFMLVNSDKAYWVFSHQHMVFVGYDLNTKAIIGYLGRQGFIDSINNISPQDQFDTVASGVNQHYIQTAQAIYRVDFEHKKIVKKHALTQMNEHYDSIPTLMFDKIAVKTNKAIYFFNEVKFTDSDDIHAPQYIADLSAAFSEDLAVQVTEVRDGFLVLSHSPHFFGVKRSGAQLSYLPHEGQSEIISSIELPTGASPTLIEYQKFMFSPIVMNIIDQTLTSIVKSKQDLPRNQGYFWQMTLPRTVLVFCLLAAVISASTTLWLARKMNMPLGQKLWWFTINLLCALPGLAAFLLLNRWRLVRQSTAIIPQSYLLKGAK